MTQQEREELIFKLLSMRRDIDVWVAYDLADMAIRGQYPDDTFSGEECLVFADYRLIVGRYLQQEGDLA